MNMPVAGGLQILMAKGKKEVLLWWQFSGVEKQVLARLSSGWMSISRWLSNVSWESSDLNGRREEKSFDLLAVFWCRETGACQAVLLVDEDIIMVVIES